MQWHRHDHVELAPSETLIVKRCVEPTCYEMSQMNLPAVLKIVNDLPDNTAAAVCGHCCIKVNCAMGAVGTCARRHNRAVEGFGALLTKRRDDRGGVCFASLAEIFASASLATAQRAYRRGKKRQRRLEQLKHSKRGHISSRCALLTKRRPLQQAG